eukprot:8166902-Prorocentrum_lima.AAC.1
MDVEEKLTTIDVEPGTDLDSDSQEGEVNSIKTGSPRLPIRRIIPLEKEVVDAIKLVHIRGLSAADMRKQRIEIVEEIREDRLPRKIMLTLL